MKLKELHFQGLMLIEQEKFHDDRGYFMESYNFKKFDAQGLSYRFLQDNNVRSRKNVLRGLHFQKLFPQTKLINCLKGNIFDVCVGDCSQPDLRVKELSITCTWWFCSWILCNV